MIVSDVERGDGIFYAEVTCALGIIPGDEINSSKF